MEHPITEQYLKQGLFKYEYFKRAAIAEIDMDKSEKNPARMQKKLDQDRAVGYGLAMDGGTEFPAIVLMNHEAPHGKFKFEVATGIHRINGALLAHRAHFDAYVVTEADQYRREVLVRQLNTLEGRGVSEEEKIQHVLWLNEHYPSKPLALLSKEWNLKIGTVQAAANEQKARARARRFNYDFARQKVPQKMAIILNSIHSDIIFAKALEVVLTIGYLQTNDVRDMANEIKKARDEKLALEIVDRWRKIAEQRATASRAKRVRVSPSAMVKFLGDVRRCNGHFDKPITELHVGTLDERDLVVAQAQVNELQNHLKSLQAELERVIQASKPIRPAA